MTAESTTTTTTSELEAPLPSIFESRRIGIESMVKCEDYHRAGALDLSGLTCLPDSCFNPFMMDPSTLIKDSLPMRRVGVMYNPHSGNGLGKHIVNSILMPSLLSSDHNITVEMIFECQKPNHLREYLLLNYNRMIQELEIDTLFIIGGDGTFFEFYDSYLRCIQHNSDNNENGELTKTECVNQMRVCLLAGGTGNSLAMILGQQRLSHPNRTPDLVAKYLSSILDDYQKPCVRWISALKVTSLISKEVRFIGGLRYDISAIVEIIKFKSRMCDIILDEGTVQLTLDVIAVNGLIGKYYGKGLMITPFAKLDSGWMDVCIICRKSRLDLIRLFTKMKSNCHYCGIDSSNKDSDAIYLRCKKLELRPFAGMQSACGIDGESSLLSPLTVECVPNAVPLLCPKE